MGKLKDNEKAGLSDQELEALDGEDEFEDQEAQSDEDDAAVESKANKEPEEQVAGDAKGEEAKAEPAEEDKPDEKPAEETEPAEAEARKASEDLSLDAPPAALLPVKDVSNYDIERGVLLDERKELRSQHREGLISFEEYEEKLDAINDKINALDRAKADADAALRHNEAVQRAQYMWAIERVKKECLSSDNIDYDKSPTLMAMWDTHVKALAVKEENATKPAEWFLRRAHELVKEDIKHAASLILGQKQEQKQTTPVKDAVAARVKTETRLRGLGELPTAGKSDVGDDEFAALDSLSGIELERALAKMPEDKAAKYLRG